MIGATIRAAIESVWTGLVDPFRRPPPPPRIHVSAPVPGDTVTSPFVVSGFGRASQQNKLGILVRDAEGNIVGHASVTVDGPPGEVGSYAGRVAYTLDNSPQPGRVEVYDESPRDGQLVYLTTVEVTLD